ncbi:MAG: hypothetical protein QM650_10260 [Microlunatus sp.]
MSDQAVLNAAPLGLERVPLTRWRSLGLDLGVFAVFLAALAGNSIPSLSWLCLAYLLVVPGDLLRRTLGVTATTVVHRLVFALSGSIAVLIADGILIQGIGMVVGVDRPFESSAVEIGVLLSTFALVCIAQRQGAAEAGPLLPTAGPGTIAVAMLPPLLTVGGSAMLSNDRGPWLLIIGFSLAAILLVRSFVGEERRRDGNALIAVYSLTLSVLWSFTLRTPYLFGYDISQEYGSFAATAQTGYWQPLTGDAYNAMLSLTAMPAILTQTTGLTGLDVFKLAYPMMFAIVPVVGLLVASRFLSRVPALVAVLVLCLNPSGIWQISAVARQEVALACFAGMLLVLLEPGGRTRARTAFAAVLGLACVFTHYSTSYVAIAVLLLAALMQRVVPILRRKRVSAAALPLTVPLLMLFLALAWNMGVNQAATNIGQAGGSFASNGGLQGNVNIIETWLKGTSPTPISPAGLFALGEEEAAKRSWMVSYPRGVQAEFPADPASADEPWSLASGLGGVDYLVFTVLRQAVLLGIVIGTGMLLATRPRVRALAARLNRRKHGGLPGAKIEAPSTAITSSIVVLAVAAILVAAAMRSSTSLSLAYNPERLATQLSPILVVPLGLVVQWLIARRRQWCRRLLIAGVAVVGLLCVLDVTGIRGLLVGTTAGNLQTRGEHVERYAQTPADVAAADWLTARFVSSNQVYADRYGVLLLRSRPEFKDGAFDILLPALLDQRGFVLGTTENIVGGRARGQIQNRYSVYTFPKPFLDKYKSRVYNNGSAGVWN